MYKIEKLYFDYYETKDLEELFELVQKDINDNDQYKLESFKIEETKYYGTGTWSSPYTGHLVLRNTISPYLPEPIILQW